MDEHRRSTPTVYRDRWFWINLYARPHGAAHTGVHGLPSTGAAHLRPRSALLPAACRRGPRSGPGGRTRRSAPQQSGGIPGGLRGREQANRVGHNLGDTMWPWNQVTVRPRPASAPGGLTAGVSCRAGSWADSTRARHVRLPGGAPRREQAWVRLRRRPICRTLDMNQDEFSDVLSDVARPQRISRAATGRPENVAATGSAFGYSSEEFPLAAYLDVLRSLLDDPPFASGHAINTLASRRDPHAQRRLLDVLAGIDSTLVDSRARAIQLLSTTCTALTSQPVGIWRSTPRRTSIRGLRQSEDSPESRGRSGAHSSPDVGTGAVGRAALGGAVAARSDAARLRIDRQHQMCRPSGRGRVFARCARPPFGRLPLSTAGCHDLRRRTSRDAVRGAGRAVPQLDWAGDQRSPSGEGSSPGAVRGRWSARFGTAPSDRGTANGATRLSGGCRCEGTCGAREHPRPGCCRWSSALSRQSAQTTTLCRSSRVRSLAGGEPLRPAESCWPHEIG